MKVIQYWIFSHLKTMMATSCSKPLVLRCDVFYSKHSFTSALFIFQERCYCYIACVAGGLYSCFAALLLCTLCLYSGDVIKFHNTLSYLPRFCCNFRD